MKIKYECCFCGRQFESKDACYCCEYSHLGNYENYKYYLMNTVDDICEFCENVYYVYGCERNCSHKDCAPKNNYKDFKLKVSL